MCLEDENLQRWWFREEVWNSSTHVDTIWECEVSLVLESSSWQRCRWSGYYLTCFGVIPPPWCYYSDTFLSCLEHDLLISWHGKAGEPELKINHSLLDVILNGMCVNVFTGAEIRVHADKGVTGVCRKKLLVWGMNNAESPLSCLTCRCLIIDQILVMWAGENRKRRSFRAAKTNSSACFQNCTLNRKISQSLSPECVCYCCHCVCFLR